MAILLAAPACPTAVKTTDAFGTAEELAVTVYVPGVVGSVQLVRLAWPFASVTALSGAMLPPLSATENETTTPGTGLPAPSLTTTRGNGLRGAPTVPLNEVLPSGWSCD